MSDDGNSSTPNWEGVKAATETFWGGQWYDPDGRLQTPIERRYAYEHMATAIRAYLLKVEEGRSA